MSATTTRPECHGSHALGGSEDRLDRGLLLPADLHGLEREGLDHGKRLGRHRERDVPRVRAKGGERCRGRGAGHARLTTDHEDCARRVLGVALSTKGDESEQSESRAAVFGRSLLEPDVGDDDPTRVEATGSDDESHLRRMEGDGEIRVDDGT